MAYTGLLHPYLQIEPHALSAICIGTRAKLASRPANPRGIYILESWRFDSCSCTGFCPIVPIRRNAILSPF